jgi:DNA-directed RNA polymerase specialized sigma24 family protein
MENNINLIRKIAWSLHKTTGFDWDDIFQESYYEYLKALRTYTPDKGYLSTYVWNFIINNMLNRINVWKRELHLSYEESGAYEIPEEVSLFWEKLSDEAHAVGTFILQNSRMFVCLETMEVEEKAKYILTTKGWSEDKIQQGLNDLKQACNQD